MSCLRGNFKEGVVLGGRYRTVASLNHGSFGMVFMARQLETGKNVAIKCLTKKAAADEADLDFAIDDQSEELVLHRHLGRHPNIVNFIESFETDAHVYLVLEYCPRGDLYEAIRNGQGPLETEHVRRFMLELVDAVAYIHSRGIYHRDIKPENIFLSQCGALKLGDFGLATRDNWTYENAVGSDRYMSPEQFDSAGAGYSPAQADIWAIGICLLNILFSRNPFTTPTEADPLFLDFSRDKQSLFDVFPSMSQDTFEVILQCMNLDPKKRSLSGVREALRRVVSFTTLDEEFDDFCSVDRRVVASANREPLRTPSIQSPQVEANNAFPWAKALQTTRPQLIRQLSAIPDESYSEDLFSQSEATSAGWCSSMTGETQSIMSMVDSSLSRSMGSLSICQPRAIPEAKQNKVSPMAGSLPIMMPQARNTPAMSLVFGRKDTVSKSWSDMWDEDEEEEERLRQMQDLKKSSAQTQSQEKTRNDQVSDKQAEKVDDDNTPRLGLSPVGSSLTIHGSAPTEREQFLSMDHDEVDDGLFFSDPVAEEKPKLTVHRHSRADGHDHAGSGRPVHYSVRLPRSHSPLSGGFSKSPYAFDKWEALGEKRRAYAGTTSASEMKSQDFGLRSGQQHFGNSLGYNFMGRGISDHFGSAVHHHNNNNNNNNNNNDTTSNHIGLSQHHVVHGVSSGHTKWGAAKDVKDRVKVGCPWNQGRGWDWGWRREGRTDLGHMEWVGGWQAARS